MPFTSSMCTLKLCGSLASFRKKLKKPYLFKLLFHLKSSTAPNSDADARLSRLLKMMIRSVLMHF